jgi:CBS domain containing-hemolysin-like protein
MDRLGTEWIGLLDGDQFAGWSQSDDVRAANATGRPLLAIERHHPAARVGPTDTLRAAMELIVLSDASVAVVEEHGRFLGVVTLADIRDHLAAEPDDAASSEPGAEPVVATT